jgi:hypothetical protein
MYSSHEYDNARLPQGAPGACQPSLRTLIDMTKRNGSRFACLTMIFKLMQSAAKRWRLLNGSLLLPDVITGLQFVDGVEHRTAARRPLFNNY